MNLKIRKVSAPVDVHSGWDELPWDGIQPNLLGEFMGDQPEHRPVVEFKIAYDAQFLYVTFKVGDRYVRAVANHYQDSVCWDSCVEFFFTPGPDVSEGYFNLEVNCGGTALFHFQKKQGQGVVPIPESDFNRIQIAHSQPETVEQELAGPVTWTLGYALPFDILRHYRSFEEPASGVTWRANFYKCGDRTSHPHWLTWSPVDNPRPNFHLPDFFGKVQFE
ncbi:MAG: carbohydrate-binding family 9-like protein [Planctomycetota bacterium]|nr:carbohydrate-binding family 9-like protein [Planctomycetota bacterium]MDA1139374.1 carbohydrate-binding family 9-like protein [Planctomycetota bacterium]